VKLLISLIEELTTGRDQTGPGELDEEGWAETTLIALKDPLILCDGKGFGDHTRLL
jgi:hypothetical protein